MLITSLESNNDEEYLKFSFPSNSTQNSQSLMQCDEFMVDDLLCSLQALSLKEEDKGKDDRAKCMDKESIKKYLKRFSKEISKEKREVEFERELDDLFIHTSRNAKSTTSKINQNKSKIEEALLEDGTRIVRGRSEDEEEKKVEIIAKDSSVKIEKISRYSRKILEEIGRESSVSILLISSIARTPEQQARAMLNNIKNTDIKRQYEIYRSFGDIVLRTFEETLGMRNLQTISQAEEEQIIATMTQKIEEIGPHKVSKHCRKDAHILNVIDISLAKYANNTTIITSLRKAISKKMESGKISKFIDEQSQNCFHIEIPQPTNKEQ